jgi:hypothetical protein
MNNYYTHKLLKRIVRFVLIPFYSDLMQYNSARPVDNILIKD